MSPGAPARHEPPGAIDAVLRRADSALVPISLTVEVTRRCNLGCVHCYAQCGAGEAGPGRTAAERHAGDPVEDGGSSELTTAQWIDVLDQAAEMGSLYLTVTGGEPLLRPDLFDIIDAALARHYAVRLFTNATLIDDPTADRIAGLGLVSVEVSLYSAQPAAHDAITGLAGSHVRTVRAIASLCSRDVKVVGKIVVFAQTVPGLDELLDFAEGLGIVVHVDPMITPTDASGMAPTGLRVDAEGYRRVLESLVRRGYSSAPVERDPGFAMCAAGRTSMAVNAAGLVVPCVGYPLAVGDVRVQPLGDIWRESPDLARVRALTVGDRTECQRCESAAFCRLCPGTALLEGGNASAKVQFACMMADTCRGHYATA